MTMSSNTPPWDVVILGAGAAGLLAAARAAERGLNTLLLEKNTKPGVKILMSGGSRCNITHDTDADGIMAAFGRNGRFLRSALAALSPQDVVQLFHAEGVLTKTEATGKIFPITDRALDVQQALVTRLHRAGAQLRLQTPALDVDLDPAGFRIRTAAGDILGRQLVISAGGKSYPGCGTTGDAYAWLAKLGHRIIPPRPALVPLTSDLPWIPNLAGITLPDVTVSIVPIADLGDGVDPAARIAAVRRHQRDQRRGSLLFTHQGLSGPAPMDVSRSVSAEPDPRRLALVVDLLPDRSLDNADADLQRAAAEHGARSLPRLIPDVIPQRLAEQLVETSDLPPLMKAAELPRTARRRLAGHLKALIIPLAGTRGFPKAEVTAGGVDLRDVDPRTMQSRVVPNLYLIGEVLDLDGYIGGYNFQSAFSTAWLAAESLRLPASVSPDR
jgi:predicted Rossmann fold flavoprotein